MCVSAQSLGFVWVTTGKCTLCSLVSVGCSTWSKLRPLWRGSSAAAASRDSYSSKAVARVAGVGPAKEEMTSCRLRSRSYGMWQKFVTQQPRAVMVLPFLLKPVFSVKLSQPPGNPGLPAAWLGWLADTPQMFFFFPHWEFQSQGHSCSCDSHLPIFWFGLAWYYLLGPGKVSFCTYA